MAEKKKSILSQVERNSYPLGTREYDRIMSGKKSTSSKIPRASHPLGTDYVDGKGGKLSKLKKHLKSKAKAYRIKNPYHSPWNSMKFYKSLITGKE